MTTRSGGLGRLASYVIASLFVLAVPRTVPGQSPSRDTTATAAPAKDLPLTAAERQAFVGTYRISLPHGGERSGRIVDENGVLRMHPDDAEPRRLLYQGNNVFHPEGLRDFVFTFVVENGRATRFTVRREDGVMEGVRMP